MRILNLFLTARSEKGKHVSSITERAKVEMELAGIGDQEAMSRILRIFFETWHSGAVWEMAPALMRLIAGKPLTPLTGGSTEWHRPIPSPPMWQNNRCSSVFKVDDGPRPPFKFRYYDIDNPAWNGTFPYLPPSKLPIDPTIEAAT